MATTVGAAQVLVRPVFTGAQTLIARQFLGFGGTAGDSLAAGLGGSGLGKIRGALSKAFEGSDGPIKRLADAEAAYGRVKDESARKVQAASRTQQAASRQLEIQQKRLLELQDSGRAKASQLAAAEDKVTRATEKLDGAERDAADALKHQSSQVESAEKSLKGHRQEVDRTKGSWGGLSRGVKVGMALAGAAVIGGTVAMARGLKSTIAPAREFDSTMRMAGFTLGATSKQTKQLTALAIDMGAKTSFSAQGAADAILELAKGGMKPAEIQAGALHQTLTLATAGGLKLGDAAGYMVNGLNAFHLSAKDAGQVSAALAGAANASTASVESLGLGLAQSSAQAHTAGLSIQDTVAALAAFDNAGIKGQDAGTSLKTMLQRLVPSTTKARDEMADLGIVTMNNQKAIDTLRQAGIKPLGKDSDTLTGQLKDYAMKLAGVDTYNTRAQTVFNKLAFSTGSLSNRFFDANGHIRSMAEVSGVLQDALKGQTKEQKIATLNTLFGSDASRAAGVLAETGAKKINEYAAAANNQASAQNLAKAATQGFAGAQERFQGGIESLQIQVGRYLLPALTGMADVFSSQILPLVSQAVEDLGPKLGPVLTAAAQGIANIVRDGIALGAWLSDNRGLVLGFAAVLGGLVLAERAHSVAMGIQTLGLKRYLLQMTLVQTATKVWSAMQWIARGATIAYTAVQWALNAAWAANPLGLIVLGLAALVGGIILAWKHSETFRNVVMAVWGGIKTAVSAAVDGVKSAISAVWGWIAGTAVPWISGLAGQIAKPFQWLYSTVFVPVGNGISSAIHAVGSAFSWLYHNVVLPVGHALATAFSAVSSAFQTVGAVMMKVYHGWIEPIFDLWAAVVKLVWGTVFKLVFGLIRAEFAILGAAIRLTYQKVIKPTLDAGGKAIQWLHGVWDKAVGLVKRGWNLFALALRLDWNRYGKPTVNAVGSVIGWLHGVWDKAVGLVKRGWNVFVWALRTDWNRYGKPVMHAVGSGIDAVRSTWHTATSKISDAWSAVGAGLKRVWTNTLQPVLDSAKRGVNAVKDAFKTAGSAVGKAWGSIKNAGASAIRFVLDKIVNHGLIKGFNAVARFFGTKQMPWVPIPFATGGLVPAPEAQPGVLPGSSRAADGDSLLVSARPGEGWTVSEAMDRYERSRLLALNKAALRGESAAAFRRRWSGQGFKTGGIVEPTATGRQNSSYAGHSGVDFYGRTGDPIYATEAGKIAYVGSGRGYGNAIFEVGANGLQMVYGHTSKQFVRAGQMVKAGQRIGAVGYSGNVRPPGPAGAHLHYEVAPAGRFALASNRAATEAFLHGANVAGQDSSGFDPLALIAGIADKVKNGLASFAEQFGQSPLGSILTAGVGKLRGFASAKAHQLWDKIGDVVSWEVNGAKDILSKGKSLAILATALKLNGLPLSLLDNWYRQTQSESGGDANAVQKVVDVNSRNGNLARGWLQVIPTTFAAYRSKSLPNDIFNRLANAYAAMNYARHNYRNLEAVIGHGHGYAGGTMNASRGWHWVGENEPELVYFNGGEQVWNSQMIADQAAGAGMPGGRLRLDGSLDMGHGLEGYVRAVARDESNRTAGAAARRANLTPAGVI